MKHYFYYIMAGREIDETAQFFKVAIGSSKQAQRDFLFLTSFSVQHNDYFEIVSRSSQEFLEKVRDSLCFDELDIKYCDARDLVRSLKANTQVATPQYVRDNADHQRRILDINYRVFSNLRGAALNHR